MVVSSVEQREIVEVPFIMPDGSIKIQDEWLNKPLGKQSFFITHLVNMFNVSDVMKRNNRFIKKNHFDEVIDVIINNIIG